MSDRCNDLDLFFDRELTTDAAQAFRDHLATCTRCQDALHGRMLEAAVLADPRAIAPSPTRPSGSQIAVARLPVSDDDSSAGWGRHAALAKAEPVEPVPDFVPQGPASAPTPIDKPRTRARRAVVAVAMSSTLVAAAAALVAVWPAGSPPPAPALAIAQPRDRALDGALAAERGVEVRFSAPALDRYRRMLVVRAADPAPTEQIGLQVLGELEQHGDRATLVGALALNGDLRSALRSANDLPRTAASLSDRAALALLQAETSTDPAGRVAQEAALQRALSLTSDALRLEPLRVQATWNYAIALRELGLTQVATRTFDELAGRREPGWSDEARTTAERLRRADRQAADDWERWKAEAHGMAVGGAVLAAETVARAPSLARDAFYLAVATAATRARLDALAPLAIALDARFATTALAALIDHVRGSDLAARAPIAAELKAALDLDRPHDALAATSARAVALGVPDIALAALLAPHESFTTPDNLALLDRLLAGNRDPWWQLIQLARHAYSAAFLARDYPAVDVLERRAAPLCGTQRSAWCTRLLRYAGGANSQMGRADLALRQLTEARQLARDAGMREEERDAIDAIGQAIAMRITHDLDAAAVAGAYLEEVSMRRASCVSKLQQLDFAATAALQYHRFDEAARAQLDADALEHGDCRATARRLNGETARVRLLLHGEGDRDALAANLARLEADDRPAHRLYLDYLRASALLLDDRSRGEAALRQVIDAAEADPTRMHAPVVRGLAFDALVDSAAGPVTTWAPDADKTNADRADAVLALLARRLHAPRDGRCVLGVASWNRRVVAARDDSGKLVLEVGEIPAGDVIIPARDAVPPAIRARFAGCHRVEVLAPGPYFGEPRLLGPEVPWSYHSGTPRDAAPHPAGHADASRELVVTDVTPPEQLHLPALQSFAGGPGAQLLSGAAATPDHVLDDMARASLIVVVAHGLTDAAEPSAASLILSPDAEGDYLLTASKVSAVKLTGAPIVVLAGCDAGRVQVSAEPWSLATSFIQAGARVVLAPTEPIPDRGAGDVFRALVDRIRAGVDPADALAEQQKRQPATTWLSSIVVFE